MAREFEDLRPFIAAGSKIAIAVGSRGIKNLQLIVSEASRFVKDCHASPFIIAAMGSHGNATADGQAEILADYGITAGEIGVPIRSSMEVVELPRADSPVPIFMDKNAFESDGIILINRIKPHTDFHARYESGLVKMSVIGLGKEKQAVAIHTYGVYGLQAVTPLVARGIFASGKILGGIAVVENARDETMLIEVLRGDEIFEREPQLLDIARRNMPFLPIDDVDVLIIDWIGKDISGAGLDPNVIGRIGIRGQKEPDKPQIKAICLSDLTAGSHGNAIGIGLADVITKKLYDKIDFQTTYTNIRASNFLERAKVPFVAGSDREAFDIAIRSCGFPNAENAKIVRIYDTLHLGKMYVSRPVLNILKDNPRIEKLAGETDLFNDDDELQAF